MHKTKPIQNSIVLSSYTYFKMHILAKSAISWVLLFICAVGNVTSQDVVLEGIALSDWGVWGGITNMTKLLNILRVHILAHIFIKKIT